MSHTRGPWTIEWYDEQGEPYDNGVCIQSPEGPVAFDVIDCSANVIAAAPELLAACRLMVALEDGDAHDADTRWKQAKKDMRAAIAKAEGRYE